jgi:cyclopropane-fatty-acyl-phospholipid synthase
MLHNVIDRFMHVGRLTITYPDGKAATYGDGSGPEVAVQVRKGWMRKIAMDPQMKLGEAYMAGGLVIERGDIWGLIEVIGRNLEFRPRNNGWLVQAVMAVERRLQQWNCRTASRRNVAHHYDLSEDFYRRFLDEDMQYSCAYFSAPDMSLEDAQKAKKAHIAAKLRLQPGSTVLDIGCGWGGLGLDLAGRHGAQVTGVTLSTEQLAVAQRRARQSGLADQARFSLTDYRDVDGPFDRIVSVGMFEHVGAPNFRGYFEQIGRLMKDDGVALVHTIGRMTPPGVTQSWIRKYIFPGGYIPALSEVSAAVEKAGLWITDVEILRLHYAETLKHWRERFAAQRAQIAVMYDERFCRMWEFYLALSELAFRFNGHVIFQLQLAKRIDAAPLTRDYMLDEERAGSNVRPAQRATAAA